MKNRVWVHRRTLSWATTVTPGTMQSLKGVAVLAKSKTFRQKQRGRARRQREIWAKALKLMKRGELNGRDLRQLGRLSKELAA